MPHAISMMLPPAWENNDQLEFPDVKAFYEYNNTLIEPWDGPAHIIFTDGTQVLALCLTVTASARDVGRSPTMVMWYCASETGVLPEVAEEHIVTKGRLEPGKMFLVDTDEGRIIPDEEIEKTLASQHPYRKWVEGNSVEFESAAPSASTSTTPVSPCSVVSAPSATPRKNLKLLLAPMANTGKEPLGSTGNDTPLAALSKHEPRMLFDYFTQKFAQVTNPPLDWEREKTVTSLESAIGPEPNLLADSELHAKKVTLIPLPVLNSDEMAQLKRLDRAKTLGLAIYKPFIVKGLYQVAGGGQALKDRLDEDLPGDRRGD